MAIHRKTPTFLLAGAIAAALLGGCSATPSSQGDAARAQSGDTPSDVTCGSALGVRAIGVATGRYHTDELLEAGAAAVFADLSATQTVLEAILC